MSLSGIVRVDSQKKNALKNHPSVYCIIIIHGCMDKDFMTLKLEMMMRQEKVHRLQGVYVVHSDVRRGGGESGDCENL